MPKHYHLCIRFLLQHFNKALNELRLQNIFRFIMFVEYIDKFRRLNSECVQENLTIPPTYNLRLVKFHCAILCIDTTVIYFTGSAILWKHTIQYTNTQETRFSRTYLCIRNVFLIVLYNYETHAYSTS